MSNIAFLNVTPCELCAEAPGDRMQEGLVICAHCAEIVGPPPVRTCAPVRAPESKPSKPTLIETLETLLRGTL